MIKASESVIGILAHVDAGKTTLTEAILYKTGAIRKLGRVDKKDSWFDSHSLERSRGITIFSKQNPFHTPDRRFTLVDTPGHTDFSAEMERTLGVLDYAVLVIDAVSGVQSHTETIWRLLGEYGIPTFIFINKIDRLQGDKAAVLAEIKHRLGDKCMDFTLPHESPTEDIALLREELLEMFLSGNRQEWNAGVTRAIAACQLCPCIFGSALNGDGVDRLLDVLNCYTATKEYQDGFSAIVYKILHDSRGDRLTFLKITGGKIAVKMQVGNEKIDSVRIYSGEKFETVNELGAGGVCAVTGLNAAHPGDLLLLDGCEQALPPKITPMLSAGVIILDSTDIHTALRNMRILGEELPELSVHINTYSGEEQITIRVMGKIQLEILKSLAEERFGMSIDFGQCRILYKETIKSPIMGFGHYEPLRHYAEVHLRLEPAPRSSGITAASECSLETLDSNFQNLALSHILEKEHIGILTGSPITDMRLVLTAGRSHLKHTEGGDFREATYRAIRQGLEKAENILLEPYYSFVLRLPGELLGRAISDIRRMNGEFEQPEQTEHEVIIKGFGPVAEFMDYPSEIASYSGGRGMISFMEKGFFPCHNAEEVIKSIGYEKERDLENPSSSVFCSHGAGFEVKWHEVDSMRHIKQRYD